MTRAHHLIDNLIRFFTCLAFTTQFAAAFETTDKSPPGTYNANPQFEVNGLRPGLTYDEAKAIIHKTFPETENPNVSPSEEYFRVQAQAADGTAVDVKFLHRIFFHLQTVLSLFF